MTQAPTEATQTQQAYAFLKNAIFNCKYLPGQEISEKQLYEELPFGRTPIRETLLRLQNEELVEIYPRRGMRISPITDQLVNELYQTRKLIEPAVAETYFPLYAKRDLMRFERELCAGDSMTDEAFYLLDTHFHNYLVAITGNNKLTGIFNDLMWHQYRLAIYAAMRHTTRRADNDPEHTRIIRAILDENPTEIRTAIVQHINRSMLETLRSLEQ